MSCCRLGNVILSSQPAFQSPSRNNDVDELTFCDAFNSELFVRGIRHDDDSAPMVIVRPTRLQYSSDGIRLLHIGKSRDFI
jgi:hypothetical protein